MGEQGSLDFSWEARFSDESVIAQFDKDGKEIKYGVVEKKIDDLEEFVIVSKNLDEMYIVNLVDKTIVGPDISYTVVGNGAELIYRRRNDVRLELGTGNRLDPRVRHIIGIKTDKEEKVVEVFYGLGMKPKKIEFVDRKKMSKLDVTGVVSAKVKQIAIAKEALLAKEADTSAIK